MPLQQLPPKRVIEAKLQALTLVSKLHGTLWCIVEKPISVFLKPIHPFIVMTRLNQIHIYQISVYHLIHQ